MFRLVCSEQNGQKPIGRICLVSKWKTYPTSTQKLLGLSTIPKGFEQTLWTFKPIKVAFYKSTNFLNIPTFYTSKKWKCTFKIVQKVEWDSIVCDKKQLLSCWRSHSVFRSYGTGKNFQISFVGISFRPCFFFLYSHCSEICKDDDWRGAQ